jgi:hypothetical protein
MDNRHCTLGRKVSILRGNKGQSTVEYLVVTFVLVAVLVKGPGLYQTVSETMKNKYHSYSFAVAISDPPRKAFDDAISKDAEKVNKAIDSLEEIKRLINDTIIPDIKKGELPSWDNVKKFGELVKRKIF